MKIEKMPVVEPSPMSIQNFGEIFCTPNTWFVDDTNVQIVTKQKTKPTDNGAVLMFNPQTGQLFLKVIDTSEFAAGQGLNLQAEWKTSKEIAAIVRAFSVEGKPKQIVVTRKGMLESLKVLLQDSPDIIIRGCELQLPIYASLITDKLGNLLDSLNLGTTGKPLTVCVNIYDNWLFEGSNSYSAFCRFILICRALAVNCQKAKMLLKPADSAAVTEVHKIWPSLTKDQWLNVEVSMKSLILLEYAKKTNNLSSSLMQSRFAILFLGLRTILQQHSRFRLY